MEELIKIRKSIKTGNPVVSARDLHEFLEVGKKFSTWLTSKLKKYGFIENVDYARIFYDMDGKVITLPKNGNSDSQSLERVYRIEYALTLDCAKELAMVQNNEKGRQARLYFIEVEKKYREMKEEATRPALYTMSDTAKRLKLTDYCGKIGRNGLLNILERNRIIKKNHQPLPKYVKMGYFTTSPVRVTEEGMKWLNQMLCVEKTSDNTELKKEIAELRETQKMLVEGVACVVETLLFNKGGHRTEEQNRIAVGHLQRFLDKANGQKALN